MCLASRCPFHNPIDCYVFPDIESSNCSQYTTNHETTPVVPTPSHVVTVSPMAVEAIPFRTDVRHTCPPPLYLRASELPDSAVGEPPVDRVVFSDECDYSIDINDRQGRPFHKWKKGKHCRWVHRKGNHNPAFDSVANTERTKGRWAE